MYIDAIVNKLNSEFCSKLGTTCDIKPLKLYKTDFGNQVSFYGNDIYEDWSVDPLPESDIENHLRKEVRNISSIFIRG